MSTVTVSPARPRRLAEIVLMVLALAIGIGGYALTVLNRTGELPANLGVHICLLVAFAAIAEALVHWLAPYADPVILPCAVALTGLGLAMIYRLDMSYEALGQSTTGIRQLVMVGAALVLAAIILGVVRDHRKLSRYAYTFMVISLILLVLPMVPGIGQEHNGAQLWVRVFGFQMQPAEFVKVTLAIFFAGYLVKNRDKLSLGGKKVLGIRLPRLRDLGPILVVWLIGVGILVFQRDFGTSLMFFGLFVVMLYTATNRVSWLVIGAVLFIPAAFVAMKLFPHVSARFTVWLNAMDVDVYNAVGGSYQVVQGQFGMAEGGLFGTGWGRGYPQLVQYAQSDFILASFGEELGLVGLLAILMLYLILVERGLRAGLGTKDGFGKLLACGLSFSLALQVFVVLGGITRVIPLTGLTAPFLAQGGSSMIASWIMIAILLRISDAARRPTVTERPWEYDAGSGIETAIRERTGGAREGDATAGPSADASTGVIPGAVLEGGDPA